MEGKAVNRDLGLFGEGPRLYLAIPSRRANRQQRTPSGSRDEVLALYTQTKRGAATDA